LNYPRQILKNPTPYSLLPTPYSLIQQRVTIMDKSTGVLNDLKDRANQLQAHHRRQILKLSLSIEENPLESSFSTALVSLMQKEELAASQQNYSAQGQFAARVDAGLKTETRRHCQMQAQESKRKWVELLERQKGERKEFFRQVDKQFWADAENVGKVEMTLDEAYLREERRLRRADYINYQSNETFNLDNAFGLQLARVDAEWAVYEQQMKTDYETQKSSILGRKKKLLNNVGKFTGTEAAGPWKSKEKQSRLFNTAPVFSPEGGNKFGGGGGGTKKQQMQQQQINSELQNLDNMFVQGKERIANQKSNAVRWISRQKTRMMCQVESVGDMRRDLNHYFVEADKELDSFFDMIAKNLLAVAGAGGGGAAHATIAALNAEGKTSSARKRFADGREDCAEEGGLADISNLGLASSPTRDILQQNSPPDNFLPLTPTPIRHF